MPSRVATCMAQWVADLYGLLHICMRCLMTAHHSEGKDWSSLRMGRPVERTFDRVHKGIVRDGCTNGGSGWQQEGGKAYPSGHCDEK